jgi:hypothetical protein
VRKVRRLTAGRVHHRAPSWSADGAWLLFQTVGAEDDASWLLCDKKGRVARVFAGQADGCGAVSVIGAVVIGKRGGELWYSPGGAVPATRLLGGDGRIYGDPAWSPDGATLAFRSADGPLGSGRIILLDLHSGMRRAVPPKTGRSDGKPAFAPDGTLFFDALIDGASAVMRFHDGNVEPVVAGRHPAPLNDRLLVVMRGESAWLIDLVTEAEIELPLPTDAGEPASASAGSTLRLSFTAGHAEPDAPLRRDVLCARIRYKTAPVVPPEIPAP